MSTILWQHTDEDGDHVSLLAGTSERFAAIVADSTDPDASVSVWLDRDAALGLHRALDQMLTATHPLREPGDARPTDAQVEAAARRIQDEAQTLANTANEIAEEGAGWIEDLARINSRLGQLVADLAGAVGRVP